eukprot:37776-Chlamydomonas_euryale.AAC.1
MREEGALLVDADEGALLVDADEGALCVDAWMCDEGVCVDARGCESANLSCSSTRSLLRRSDSCSGPFKAVLTAALLLPASAHRRKGTPGVEAAALPPPLWPRRRVA